VHLAAAMELGFEFFVTFDERPQKVAKAADLLVKF